MTRLKSLAAGLALALSAALAACGPGDPTSAGAEALTWGTVEALQDAGEADPQAEPAADYEHSLLSDPGEELVVRLDDGTRVTVMASAGRRYESGQRVRVLVGPEGALLL